MSDDAETKKEIRRLEQKAKDFSKAANTRERAANRAGKNSKVYATYINMLKQASELRQQAAKLKSGTIKSGGGSRGKDGTVRGLGSDLDPKALVKSTKKSIDFRKGGMVLSTVDNRRNK
jgi:hypothetical protein